MALVTPGVFSGGFARGAGAAQSAMALKETMAQNQSERDRLMREEMRKNWEAISEQLNAAIVELETKKNAGAYSTNMQAYERQRADYEKVINEIVSSQVEMAIKAGIDPMVPISIIEKSRYGTNIEAQQLSEAVGEGRKEAAIRTAAAEVSPMEGAKWSQDEEGNLVAITEEGKTKTFHGLKPPSKAEGSLTTNKLVAQILQQVLVKGINSLDDNQWDVLTLAREDKTIDLFMAGQIRELLANKPGKTETELPIVDGKQVTEEEIEAAMKKHNLTREQVLERIK